MRKLFGHPDSGHAYKVRLFLSVAGIEHDYEVVDIWKPRDQRSAEFQSVAPLGEVPVLIEDGQAYAQSNAILLHMARKAGQWGGETSQRLNACEQWLVWEANKIGLCLPQIRSYEKFDKEALLENALPWLKARYESDVATIESALSHGQSWLLAGNEPSIADFSVCGYLFFADEANVDVPLNVKAWLDRLASLKGWQHPYQLLA